MNGVPDYFEFSVKQTAAGVWYIDRLHVADKSMNAAAAKLDLAMSEVEQVLFKHNHKETQPKKENK